MMFANVPWEDAHKARKRSARALSNSYALQDRMAAGAE
jgi:hypothetical protein